MTWISGKPECCLNPSCNAAPGYLVVERETLVNGVIVGEAICSVCGEMSRYTRRQDKAPPRQKKEAIMIWHNVKTTPQRWRIK